MKIIVGLGNPGRKYERTRHNAGFTAVDELAKNLHADIIQEKHHALIGKATIGTEPVVLVKPQTYMNDSGRSVAAVLRDTYTTAADLVVVHDELDLPFGAVRIKIGGGHGGHNGLRSLLELVGAADFIRVRIGIGRPAPGLDAADYVLSPFLAEERQIAAEVMTKAADAITMLIAEGPIPAMNRFNRQ